jgi:hypothetical protein
LSRKSCGPRPRAPPGAGDVSLWIGTRRTPHWPTVRSAKGVYMVEDPRGLEMLGWRTIANTSPLEIRIEPSRPKNPSAGGVGRDPPPSSRHPLQSTFATSLLFTGAQFPSLNDSLGILFPVAALARGAALAR